MKTLDCESYESALASISDAYGVSTGEMENFLFGIDLEGEWYKTSDICLTEILESKFGTPIALWDVVCWFHLTRVQADANFSEGILPLHLVLERIWELIATVLEPKKRDNLRRLRQTGIPGHWGHLYKIKTQNSDNSGPYAMLVRESAFHSEEMGNHDYLESP